MAWDTMLQKHVLNCVLVALALRATQAAPGSVPGFINSDGQGCSGRLLKQSCQWSTVEAREQLVDVSGSWPASSGFLPFVELPTSTNKAPTVLPGFSLSLQRVVLTNVVLIDPKAAGAPVLWPSNMFTAVGTSLSLTDVRLVLSEEDFQVYLSFFQSLPQPPNIFFTDGSSFIQVPEWTDGTTTLHSVTLLGGPCSEGKAAAFLQPAAPAEASSSSGCNVRSVNNSTLIPLLQRNGSLLTDEMLLVLLLSNATVGYGLEPGAIDIGRPVIVAGLFSVPTSIDFGMVVNQINGTAKHAQVIWQSLYLENLSPADGLGATLAPPYSGAVSANVYPIYCNRSSQICLNLYNTTSVLATSQEMDYLTFMYSMFNSPLPNMRQRMEFYHTELAMKVLDMGPGPGGFGMTIHNMSCSAWEIHNGVFTDQPILRIAPKLPFPEGRPLVTASTKAAPWVQGVQDCAGLQAAMLAPSEEDRLHVWMLLGNVSVNPPSDPDCWQARKVPYTTQLYGQVHRTGVKQAASAVPAGAAITPSGTAAGTPEFDMYTLGMDYMPSAWELPARAGEKFLQLQNVTLLQLPQGPNAAAAADMAVGSNGPTPPDIWTILLWSVNRTWQGSPLYVSDVQLLVPQPEYDFVRATAETSGSFVVQLADTVGLAFTGISIAGNAVQIANLQGPGIQGQNVWLLADPQAAAAMPGGYVWPAGVSAVSTGSNPGTSGSSSSSSTVAAAVGASIGVVGLLALAGLCWWWCTRRRQQRQQQFLVGYKPNGSLHSSSLGGSAGSGPGMPLHPAAGQFVSLDVLQLQDKAADMIVSPGKVGAHHPQMGSCGSDQLMPVSMSGSGRMTATCSNDSSNNTLSQMSPAVVSGQTAHTGSGSDTVASGLLRWKAAINSTTMQLMERRMHVSGTAATGASGSSTGSGQMQAANGFGSTSANAGNDSKTASNQQVAARQTAMGSIPAAASQPSSLQLQELIGQGSFGCVYQGIWHGKRVAVKVMQLPASALLGPQPSEQVNGLTAQQARQRQAKQAQANKAPHMAIMETVVSSTMSHPNVVQVYTYMLNPLTVEADGGPDSGAEQSKQGTSASTNRGNISGWELRLVMEFCDQGTLREALDYKLLSRDHSSGFLQPSIVLSLAHDVAAAMLHLHSEGVVHGDLKAANVLLTRGGDDPGNVWAAAVGHRVTAKVADFGLALPLDPNDTHATMAARGTPTHMSPELFLSGHVSKASDVYAYGILLYEVITGQRAYAGVPIPLLPHEVARQGLRPTWPSTLPSSYKDLQQLAEACWAQNPQDRPHFQLVFNILDAYLTGRQPPSLPQQQQQPQQTQLDPGQKALPAGSKDLDEQSQEQLALVQQQLEQRFGATGGVKQSAAAGKDMAWSEVTYGAMH